MANKALVVGGLAAAGLAALALASREARADEPALPQPEGPPPPPPPSGGSGMSLDEKAFCMRQHPNYWSWAEADQKCRALDASNPANIDAVMSWCGGALGLWNAMLSDCGVTRSEESAVYNLLVGGRNTYPMLTSPSDFYEGQF
jgi:hypothetical protein